MTESPVALLDIEPDLIRFLTADDQAIARRIPFPVMTLPEGVFDVKAELARAGAFASLVLEGMFQHRVEMGERAGLRLVGPGDFISVTYVPRSMLIGDSVCRVLEPARLALIGRETLAACRRWPALLAGLQVRQAEQQERIIAQLMICQLPRVGDRLLSLLWLLAETWGQVGPEGTVLPISLTHEMLGGLIGAQRSTVSLALKELAEDGAVIRTRSGWRLPGEPPRADRDVSAPEVRTPLED